MSRWIQHGCVIVAAAAVTLAGATLRAQQGNAAATATVGVGAKPGTLQKTGEKADKALEKAGEKLDDATKRAEEAAAKAQDKAAAAADRAEDAADKAVDKAEDAANRAADKAEKAADKVAEKAGEKLDDASRAAKKAEWDLRTDAHRQAVRAELIGALKGQAMTEGMRQEVKRHARRIARLERVKAVAKEAKDDAAAERADKLIQKENARHGNFLATFDAKVDVKAGAK